MFARALTLILLASASTVPSLTAAAQEPGTAALTPDSPRSLDEYDDYERSLEEWRRLLRLQYSAARRAHSDAVRAHRASCGRRCPLPPWLESEREALRAMQQQYIDVRLAEREAQVELRRWYGIEHRFRLELGYDGALWRSVHLDDAPGFSLRRYRQPSAIVAANYEVRLGSRVAVMAGVAVLVGAASVSVGEIYLGGADSEDDEELDRRTSYGVGHGYLVESGVRLRFGRRFWSGLIAQFRLLVPPRRRANLDGVGLRVRVSHPMTAVMVRVPFMVELDRYGQYRAEASIGLGKRLTRRDERAGVFHVGVRLSRAF